MRHPSAFLFALSLWALPALAHPHVFVDAGLRLIQNAEDQIIGIEVTWTYDDFHTLLLLEDHGFDTDGDGALTEAERAALIGFDLSDWPDWFEGGLFVYSGEQKQVLGAPEALSLELVDGRLVTRHLRPLEPVSPDGLVLRPFDPSYFAAITLTGTVETPADCTGHILNADPGEAGRQAAALLRDGGEAAFEDVAVGVLFADTLVVECARS